MKIGSLFTGYGGLDLAISGEIVWYSDIDKGSCIVLRDHLPNVPNLGDIKKVTWSDVPPIDVLTGGYPCQPFSQAGFRKGSEDERHLWPYVRDAIDALRPRVVILENVRGHLTLGFADVLADLARIGYNARWCVVRASDAGAPHKRSRLFILAYPNGTRLQRSSILSKGFRWEESWGTTRSNRSSIPSHPNSHGHGIKLHTGGMGGINWGKYEKAIRRWEEATRKAPNPIVIVNERPRLSPVFVEWMMGLPEGWVTRHNLSSTQELKMLGNGVVPQQARFAIELLG
jgi:DNA (cytosine-5)-methyltransferase 1